jgi:hypothetical protein
LRNKDVDGDNGSGIFPAASLSNMDSRSDSWPARAGAGGSGLFRSFGDRDRGQVTGLLERFPGATVI